MIQASRNLGLLLVLLPAVSDAHPTLLEHISWCLSGAECRLGNLSIRLHC